MGFSFSSSPGPSSPPAASRVRQAILRELTRDRQEVLDRAETFATCLVGAPDLGKGWIVETALHEAESEGFRTLVCRADQGDAQTPLSLFRGALASWRRGTGPAAGAGGDREAPARTSVNLPAGRFELSPMLLEVAMPTASEEEVPVSPASSAAQYERLVHSLADPTQTALDKRSRLLTQIRSFLVDQARQAPLVLALEDLQLADKVSADLVAVLLEWRPKAPLWILVTYSAEEDLYPPLRRALERTFLSRSAVRRPVSPLTAGELRLFLIQQEERAPLPGAILDEIVSRSQGLPGAALRLARTFLSTGTLPGPVPQGAEGVRDPLLSLTEDQERVLSFAAVAGPSAGFELLRRAAGEEEEHMAELLEELVQRGLLTERAGGIYSVSEEEVRRRVYQGLTQARRRIVHRKIAEALEGLPGPRDAARVFALAHHFTEGGSDEKALQYLQLSIRFAREAGSLSREQELLSQALKVHHRAHAGDHRGEGALLHQLGSVAYALGSDDEASQALTRARDLLQNVHETGAGYAGVLLDLARVTLRRGDRAVSASLADEALRIFERVDDPLGIGIVRRFRSRLNYSAGEYAEAKEDLRLCLEALRRGAGDPVEIGRTLTQIADAEFMADHSTRPTATKQLEEGIEMLRSHGDLSGALFAILGRCAIELALGDPSSSDATFSRAKELAPEVPEVWRLQEAMLRKGANHIAKGEFDEAFGHGIMAARLAEVLGDFERQGRALIFAVDAVGRVGDLEQAEKLAQQAMDLGARYGLARTTAEALFRLATSAYMRGDEPLARERLDRAEQLAQGTEVSRTAQVLRRDLRNSLEPGSDGVG